MPERPTFSQSWSRVSRLTPTLRPQVEIARHLFRGEPWHVVHDPVSNSFFRLNPVAHHFVGLLDGRRQVDEAWRLTLDRFGDAAPTQNEVIGLLGQLNESNLLRVDLPADAEPLLRRHNTRRMKWWGGQAMSVLFLRIPVFNPDQLIKWLLPIFKPIMTKWGMLVWAIVVALGIYQFIPYAGQFIRDTESILAPSNWGWMILLFLATKALHEIGHGLVCKKFGGIVPEMGIMLLVLFPAPYVDATSAWALPSKWKRFLVGSAGMVFELFLAAIAVWFWVAAVESGETGLVRQITYNLIFLASVSTILFNANPLLRFDGYYMLSDLLEVPNLYQRAQNHMKYLIKRFAYGMDNAQPVAVSGKEAFWLLFYGICALIYRVLILFGIIMFIAGKLYVVGLALAIWSTIAWGFIPLCKFIHWLFTHPSLYEHRARAMTVTGAFVALLAVTLGIIPMDDHRRANGVVESSERADVVVQTNGIVTEVRAEAGRPIKKGEVILVAENPELEERRAEVRSELERLQIALRQAIAEDQLDVKQVRSRIDTLEQAADELDNRLADLTIVSPRDGTLITKNTKHLLGQYLKRGEVLGRVADMDNLRVTAVIDQTHSASAFHDQIARAEVRTAGRLAKPLEADILRVFETGQRRLPHAALGYPAGGPIPVEQDDRRGITAMRPLFHVWLELPQTVDDDGKPRETSAALPGERIHVRFTLQEKKPLIVQWLHRLRQMFRERLQM